MVFFIILLVVLSLVCLYFIFVHFSSKRELIKRFSTGNVIVAGPKGYGKDVLFQGIINWRKDSYFSNLDYGNEFNEICPKQLDLEPNTYENFINGQIITCEKIKQLEGKDIYFSDGGVIFPSQADSLLHKTYKGLPIFFALNRHLYNNGMHINTQRLDRVWKALREQADSYVIIRKRRLKLPFHIVVFVRFYDKYESAIENVCPIKSRHFNKFSKAEVDLYKAKKGYIKDGLVFISKRKLYYDSRAFHTKMFGYPYEKNECKNLE